MLNSAVPSFALNSHEVFSLNLLAGGASAVVPSPSWVRVNSNGSPLMPTRAVQDSEAAKHWMSSDHPRTVFGDRGNSAEEAVADQAAVLVHRRDHLIGAVVGQFGRCGGVDEGVVGG